MVEIAILLSGDQLTLVQIDPAFCAFTVAAPMGSPFPVDPEPVTVNANYFDEGTATPIGIMVQDGQPFSDGIPLPEHKPRTALVLQAGTARFTEPLSGAGVEAALTAGEWSHATVIQAGPRLVRDGQVVRGDPENFAGSGALVRSRHVAIGISAAGKLLFLYSEESSPRELTHLLVEHGAVDGMKVDGGHAAYLRHGSLHRGAVNPFTALTAAPSTG